MDQTPAWTQLPEVKPLAVRRGFLGGLFVALVGTASSALSGRPPADIAEVALVALTPVVLLTLLAIRTNRRLSPPGRR